MRLTAPVLCSPWRSARETANAIGVAAEIAAPLANLDHGRWSGRGFGAIMAEEPEALAQWLADPASGAPEGESMTAAKTRIGPWLDALAETNVSHAAITHPMMIRAALAHALGLPLAATLSIDIAPLSRALLSFNRKWRLQGLVPS